MFYVYTNGPYKEEEWRTLVHVCRRWRTLVFGSPHRLNLQLFCSIRTLVLAKLDIWPALPIVVYQHYFRKPNLDNLIAAIKHNERVTPRMQYCIDFHSPFGIRQLEKILSVMQVPFPALTNLKLTLGRWNRTTAVHLDLFLGRSAPRLRHIELKGFSFQRIT